MKLSEIDLLSEGGVFSLNEEFKHTLKDLIAAKLANPYKTGISDLKSKLAQEFAPTLKTWAMQRYHHNHRVQSKSDNGILQKIVNNPEKVAQQLLDHYMKTSIDWEGFEELQQKMTQQTQR